ncbi:hypothetical protein VPH35_131105 [Triticum aestivum]
MSSSSSTRVSQLGAAGLLAALLAAVCLLHAGGAAAAELCVDYYDCTCPDAYKIVQGVLMEAHQSDPRIFASLIRLHFHDCFVQGCDGSLLLDTFDGMESEKDARPNNGSARGFEVVDAAKAALEDACPGVVSCADILAIAAEISVELSGGPGWNVLLGRLDSFTSSKADAENLPGPFDGLDVLRAKFRNATLDDTTDLVALSVSVRHGPAVQLQRDEPARPDPRRDIPSLPVTEMPEERRRNVPERPRPDHARQLRQELLHQPRGEPRLPSVRPGAQVGPRRGGDDGADRRSVRRQPGGLLQ